MKRIHANGKLKWGLSIAWLLIIVTAAFLNDLGGIGLLDKTEAMFVEAAREMVDSGDWITPYWNGQTRFDKPPLIYWLIGGGFTSFGMNEWVARLPSALFAIGLTVLGFYTLLCFGNRTREPSLKNQPAPEKRERGLFFKSAWIGAAALALNPAWIAWGRTAVSDMLLAANIGMAMLSFFMGYARRHASDAQSAEASDRWYLLFYIFTALAVLAKGPVGAVLPVMGVTLFLFYLGNLKQVFMETRPLRGLLVSAAIAVPWFVLVTFANGEDYVKTFFGHHNFERFTSVVSNHRAPWYFYFPVVLFGLFPWSAYLPVAMGRLRFWKRRHWQKSPRSSQLGLFALFWFLSTFLFFTVSVTKLPSYVLPLMPAGAILVALMFANLMALNPHKEKKGKNTGIFISALVNIFLFALLAAGALFAVKLMGRDPATPHLKETIMASGLPALNAFIWGTGAIVTAYLLFKRRRWRWLWSSNAGVMLAFVLFVVPPAASIVDTARNLPLRQLSRVAADLQRPGEGLIAIGPIKPSIGFYTRQILDYVNTPEEALAHIRKQADKGGSFLVVFDKNRESKSTVLKQLDPQPLSSAGVYELVRIRYPPTIRQGERISKNDEAG